MSATPRVALYARVSTLEQDVQAQVARLRPVVSGIGTVVEEYVDDGVSGRLDSRPDFERLRDDIRARRLDVVVAQPDDKPAAPGFELTTEAVLEHINARRSKLRLKTLTPMGLGSILGDLGFKRDVDWLKARSGANRNKAVLFPARFLKEPAQPAQPDQETLEDPHSRDEEPDSGQSGPAGPAGPGTYGADPVSVELPDRDGPVVEETENWIVPPKDRARPKEAGA